MGLFDKRKTWPSIQLRDHKGNTVDINYTNGLSGSLNPTSDYDVDLELSSIGVFIIPLETGTIKVQLLDQLDGEFYLFEAEEVDAYLGRPFEGRVKKIFASGTSVTRIKLVW
jgi:hypothetical protein